MTKKRIKTPPKKPKSVKFISKTNVLTGQKSKGSVYGRGSKNWATKIKDYYNSEPNNKLKWKLESYNEIVNGRRVKSYTVVAVRKKTKKTR
jgi:hypothetical protein